MEAENQQLKSEVQALNARVLAQRLTPEQSQVFNYLQSNKTGSGTGGTQGGNPPPPYSPSGPTNVISDIGCRRKLGLYFKGDPVKEGAATTAQVPQQRPFFGCNELYPWTRLVFENATLGASDAYTNVAGYPSATSPIVQQTGNSYQFGVGYTQKPFLKQLRRLVYWKSDHDPAIDNQGSLQEDLLYNALSMNAGISYGKTLTIKNQSVTESQNSRPSYSLGANYSLDLERLWIHIAHSDWKLDDRRDSRGTSDAGYYYEPTEAGPSPSQNFWPARQWVVKPLF
jgi:hypothetical protein